MGYSGRREPLFWAEVDRWRKNMAERRFVLVDFRYTNEAMGHIRLYEAGQTYAMPRALAHAAAKRELVAAQKPVDWAPPSILSSLEVLTE
jgi:hypothetical protein